MGTQEPVGSVGSVGSVGRVVIVGSGVAGLATALTLARRGHGVTLFERDATPMPGDAAAAFALDRRGAPQVRHSHALLARLRNELRDHHPDVLAALFAAGATEVSFTDPLPPTITDRTPHPGDEDLVALACRRTTFEWVLRRAVLAEENVELRDDVTVEGLNFADRTPGEPVTVTGVRPAGAGAIAGLVVAAMGRRSPLPRWLATAGVQLDEREEDTGIVYLSRFYGAGATPADAAPDPVDASGGGLGVGDLGFVKYALFPGDGGTFSVTFAVRHHDDELRKALLDPDRFDAAARTIPRLGERLGGGAAALTGVNAMAGLVNRRVHFLDGDDRPHVVGLHAVGDAHTCTNPLYGRGCSLALVQARLLADALDAHPHDDVARAQAYERASIVEIWPWHRAAVAQDRWDRQRAQDEGATGEGQPPGPADVRADVRADAAEDPRPALADLLRHGLMPAVRRDAVVYRAFVRMFNLLTPPDALMRDGDVIGRVLAAYQNREAGDATADDERGPTRREFLDAR